MQRGHQLDARRRTAARRAAGARRAPRRRRAPTASSSAVSVGSPSVRRLRVVAEHAREPQLAIVAVGVQSASTRIRFCVSVPVLSDATTVVLPSVSTAGRCRMIACRRAIRRTPTASAIVTTAGSPSGTAATARLMPGQRGVGEREAAHGGDDARAATAATPIATVITRPKRARSRVSGVSSGLTPSSSVEIRPSSVRGAGRDGHAAAAARGHDGAGVEHAAALGQRRVGGDRLRRPCRPARTRRSARPPARAAPRRRAAARRPPRGRPARPRAGRRARPARLGSRPTRRRGARGRARRPARPAPRSPARRGTPARTRSAR